MRIRRPPISEEDLEVNMTPMLDIVFIMLIFFIVTAVFVKDTGIEVARPDADTAKDIKRISTLIAVSTDNKIWINKEEVNLADIPIIVSKLKAENPKGEIVITADKDSHSGLVVQLVEQLNLIGVNGVSVATKGGSQS